MGGMVHSSWEVCLISSGSVNECHKFQGTDGETESSKARLLSPFICLTKYISLLYHYCAPGIVFVKLCISEAMH